MLRIATVRNVLAILGVCFLLLSPAGICAGAGIATEQSPSHPCCPKPPADTADSPCLCIDREPAAPTTASVSVIAPAPAPVTEPPAPAPEFVAVEIAPAATHTILLSIHQLLL